MIICWRDARQTEKLFRFSPLVSVSSLDMAFQTLSLLVVSIPTWLWQPTMTQIYGIIILTVSLA